MLYWGRAGKGEEEKKLKKKRPDTRLEGGEAKFKPRDVDPEDFLP